MKQYVTSEKALGFGADDAVYYVGQTSEVKSMYKSIVRNRVTDIIPLFADAPVFSTQKRAYALKISSGNMMSVLSPDTMLALIADGDVTELQ